MNEKSNDPVEGLSKENSTTREVVNTVRRLSAREYFDEFYPGLEDSSKSLPSFGPDDINFIPSQSNFSKVLRKIISISNSINQEVAPVSLKTEMRRIFGDVIDFDRELTVGNMVNELQEVNGDLLFSIQDNTQEMVNQLMMFSMPMFGFTFQKNEKNEFVIDSLVDHPKNPAKISGLQKGDRIVSVDGLTRELDIRKALNEGVLRVKIVIERDGSMSEYVIEPGDINKISFEDRIMPNNSLYCKIGFLNTQTLEKIQESVRRSHERLVLDLRGSSGGNDKSELVALLDFFLPKASLMTTRKITGERVEVFSETSNGDYPKDKDIIILVDKGTSFRAEHFVRIMKERGRAKIAGKPTMGTAFDYSGYRVDDRFTFTVSDTKFEGVNPQESVTPDVKFETFLKRFNSGDLKKLMKSF